MKTEIISSQQINIKEALEMNVDDGAVFAEAAAGFPVDLAAERGNAVVFQDLSYTQTILYIKFERK